MRCNPWRWLWGLLLIAPLSWITYYRERPNIEADLTARAQEALGKGGYDWAVTGFSGRDAVVTGRATDETEPKQAFDAVRKLWGVRVVDLRTDLVQKVEKFLWSATKTGDAVKLTGYVPSEDVRKSVLSAVKASLPSAKVDDAMSVARGAPSRDLWLSGVGFGLKQLASLKKGTVESDGTSLTIIGEAQDSAGYKAIRTALTGGMPKGWNLAREKVTAPVVSPYTWSAKLTDKQLLLGGYVPGEKIRDELFAQAKKSFPKLAIVDRMETAEGAPDGWAKAAGVVIDQLYQLKEGAADMRGKELSLTGVAEEEATAGTVKKAFKSGVPSSFKATEKITFLKPTLQVASPFRTAVAVSGGAVELTGYVPSEAARQAVVAAVKAKLPGKTIKDKLQLAAGASDGWQTCMLAGVAGAGRLGGGTLEISDKKLLLSGEAQDAATADAISSEVTAAVGRSCDATVRIASAAVAQAAAPVPAPVAEPAPQAQPAAVDDGKRKAELEARWREAEARWDALNADYDRNRAAREASEMSAAEAKALAEAEARRKAEFEARWREAEARWAATNDAYERDRAAREAELEMRRRQQEADAANKLAERKQRRDAAGKCEKLLMDAATEGIILFERASADLSGKSTPTLQRLAKIMNQCPEFRVEIEGHTDSEGIPERNNPLSERRAKSVADFLVKAGVAAARLSSVGYGAERPIAPNDTPQNMAKNRRIEFRVNTD